MKLNQQKRKDDDEMISDQEIWAAIRDLDPDLDRSASDVAVIIAVVAVISIIVGFVYVLFHLGGL